MTQIANDDPKNTMVITHRSAAAIEEQPEFVVLNL